MTIMTTVDKKKKTANLVLRFKLRRKQQACHDKTDESRPIDIHLRPRLSPPLAYCNALYIL